MRKGPFTFRLQGKMKHLLKHRIIRRWLKHAGKAYEKEIKSLPAIRALENLKNEIYGTNTRS